ncbi:S-adenosyl-L-methionine-dependent methyltransferase [Daedalea quercina L-15889]|uniref:S-adenosyl-L-methionine-dependent methyltransferase n=1 Tax=Daedalea quercina L-15889 TaxID=1314783 RepID=A0A165L4F8_9APHY|nr:S-adenosyl-L-methionine-dependent methyltransferase [Daedalea quercina L-15889]
MSLAEKIETLRSLVRLINDASEVVFQEWQAELKSPSPDPLSSLLPSPELFEGRRSLLGACGMVSDIIAEPQQRLMEMSVGYFTSRALHIAADAHVAEILAGADPAEGMHVKEIAHKAGTEQWKLARVLRTLSSVHVFTEVKEFCFANTWSSQAMVGNDPLRCWVLAHGLDGYSAFQTDLTFWEFLEMGVQQADGTITPRRELELFSLAMLGGGRVPAPPLYADYPWASLGSATVVDVGRSGMCLELAKRYPDLKFVLQDRPPAIEKAKSVWQDELPEAVESQRITFMDHDFFRTQPVKGAEVYFMRSVLHDWPDEESCAILKHLCDAMCPHSRILTADHVLHTTLGSKFPQDMNMMTLFKAKERTPEDLDTLAKRVSLKVVKVWECRGMLSITQMRRQEDVTSNGDAVHGVEAH